MAPWVLQQQWDLQACTYLMCLDRLQRRLPFRMQQQLPQHTQLRVLAFPLGITRSDDLPRLLAGGECMVLDSVSKAGVLGIADGQEVLRLCGEKNVSA